MNAGEWPDQRPRRRRLTEMLPDRLDEVVEGDPNGKTYAEAFIEALLNRATRACVRQTQLAEKL
jgi:hypothetical protein